MLRRKDFHFTSVRKDFLDKVVCRGQIITEYGIAVSILDFLLGMMQRKGPEILFLRTIYFQLDNLRRTVVLRYYSEGIIEILFGLKSFGITNALPVCDKA